MDTQILTQLEAIFLHDLLVGLQKGYILNLVKFGCLGAEKKWDTVWVVAISLNPGVLNSNRTKR